MWPALRRANHTSWPAAAYVRSLVRCALSASSRAALRALLATRPAHRVVLVVDGMSYAQRRRHPACASVRQSPTADGGSRGLGVVRRTPSAWSTTLAALPKARLCATRPPGARPSRPLGPGRALRTWRHARRAPRQPAGFQADLVDTRARAGRPGGLSPRDWPGANDQPLLGQFCPDPNPDPTQRTWAAALPDRVRGAAPFPELSRRLECSGR